MAARHCIRSLATSKEPKARASRRAFEKSFRAFAHVKNVAVGPDISDLTKMNVAPTSNDKHTQCLRSLHTVLCKLSYCSESIEGNDFTANVALSSIIHDAINHDPFKVDMVFAHHHHVAIGGHGEWKQARINVFEE